MKYLFYWLILFFSLSVTGQETPLLKWNQIPEEDLQMTVYGPDSSAAAVVLADHGQIILELEGSAAYYRYKRHRRIKVLNPEGFKKANIIIPYYTAKKYAETITYLKGQIFAPDGTKVVIPNKDIFNNPINESFAEKRFTFPQVQAGSVLEYRYEIVSPQITELRDWYFQEDIPVRSSRLKVEIPNAFKYVYLFQGNQQINQTGKDDRAIDVRGNTITKIKDNVYQMVNVPALKTEKYITSINDHRARLRFQLKEILFPRGHVQSYLSNWAEVSTSLWNQERFGKQFMDEKMFSEWINPATTKILSANISDREKAAALYQYVSKTIKWNKRYYFRVKTTLNDVFLEKTGNSGEINLAYLALLRHAGIKAHPVLISTRSHGRMIKTYPIVDQFNHVIISAELDDEMALLDVGLSTKSMDYPNINSLNKSGWLLDEDTPQWIDIEGPVTKTTTMATLKLNNNGVLTGKLQGKFKGYAGATLRAYLANEKNKEKYPTSWTEQIPGLEVDSIFTKNTDVYDKSLHLIAQVKTSELVEKKEDLLYFQAVFTSDFLKNKLPDENRACPVEMAFPKTENFVLNLELPAGYEVESLPTSVSLSLADDSVNYNLLVSVQGQFLQLISKVNIKKTTFPLAAYEDLRELFIQIEEKLKEKIVLKKMADK